MPYSVNTITAKYHRTQISGKKVILDNYNSGCKATCTTPRWDLLHASPHEPLAVDIEFQEAKHKDAAKWSHRMGRIALVNTRGDTILDVCTHYPRHVDVAVKLPPEKFGVSWKDLQPENGAKPSEEVEGWLREILKDRLIVGSGMRLDLIAVGDVLQNNHAIFDCQHHYGVINLPQLAQDHLDETFDWHEPVDDARIAMLLYLKVYPYEGRDSFKDPPYQHVAQDFPSLGSAMGMETRK